MSAGKAEGSQFETRREISNAGEKSTTDPGPIEMVGLGRLRLARRNARTHSKKQIRQIDSMLRFGVINPLIVDDQGRIVAGHGRFAAAELLGPNAFRSSDFRTSARKKSALTGWPT